MHRATPQFWLRYWQLPEPVREIADKNFELLKQNSRHASLQFKKIGKFGSAQVGLAHRALAIQDGSDFIRVWIGHHNDYDLMVRC